MKGCEGLYRIDIMTLFPDSVDGVLSESILGRAQERNILHIQTHQIRDYTVNRQNQVDDYPYGGGGEVLFFKPIPSTAAGNISNSRAAAIPTPFFSPLAASPLPKQMQSVWPGSTTI